MASDHIDRRQFLHGAAASAAALALGEPNATSLLVPLQQDPVISRIAAQHDATVKMLQDWIALPSIAAEDKGYPQGAEYMANLARNAGFQQVEIVPTTGQPGVFATLDSGAANSLAIYFMYDVKQFDPAEWTSPPLEGRLVDHDSEAGPGEFIWRPAGSRHDAWAPEGCLILGIFQVPNRFYEKDGATTDMLGQDWDAAWGIGRERRSA